MDTLVNVLVIVQPPWSELDAELRATLSNFCQAPRHRQPVIAPYTTIIETEPPQVVSHCESCARQICADTGQSWPPDMVTSRG